MMPGETHSAAPGTAADLSRCQGCASLQQNLNEYVEALITLKQKIINTEENSTLHHQVEQMLQKISPLQKCQEELGSLKAELEEKKSSLKLYQDTHQEYARVKEECLKSDAQKKKLEAKVKKLEEAAVKQTQDFKQLRNEKKILEKEFKKTQERLDEFSKQKNEKELRHIGTQISSDSYGSIDKRKVKLLLKELWLCVNTTHRLPGEGSTCVPEKPAEENTRCRVSGKDGALPPAQGSPLRASDVQTCLTKLSMEIAGDLSSCKNVEKERPGRANYSIDHVFNEDGNPEVVMQSHNDGDSTDFSDHDHFFDEDLQAAIDFFKLPPPLLSPVPSPPLMSSPHVASLPSSLAPETYFGEYTDSSDNDSAQLRNSTESVSEDDTTESQNYLGSFRKNKESSIWQEKPKSHGPIQALNTLEVNKTTTLGFETSTAALREPLAREKHWTVSSQFVSDRKRDILQEARKQTEIREKDKSVQTDPKPTRSLCIEKLSGSPAQGKEAAPGEPELWDSPLSRRPLNEPKESEGKTLLSKVIGSPTSEFTKWTLTKEITSESDCVTGSDHLQRASGEMEKETEDMQGFILGESPDSEDDAGDAMDAAGLDVEASVSSSSSVTLSLCSNPQLSSGLECVNDTHIPTDIFPTELHHLEQNLQTKTLNTLHLQSEPTECSVGGNSLENSLRALSTELRASNFNDQKSSEIECTKVVKGMTKIHLFPQSVFMKATKDGQCESQDTGMELALSKPDFTSLIDSQAGLIKGGLDFLKSTSWHHSNLLRRGGEESLRAKSEHEQKAAPSLQNKGPAPKLDLPRENNNPLEFKTTTSLLPNQVSVITKQARPEKIPSAKLEHLRLQGNEPTTLATGKSDNETDGMSSTAICGGERDDTTQNSKEVAAVKSASPEVSPSRRKLDFSSPSGSLPVENSDCSTNTELSFSSENIFVQNQDIVKEAAVQGEAAKQRQLPRATDPDSSGTGGGEPLPATEVLASGGFLVEENPCEALAVANSSPSTLQNANELLKLKSKNPGRAFPECFVTTGTSFSSAFCGKDGETQSISPSSLAGTLHCFAGIREGKEDTEVEESEGLSCSEGEREPEAVMGNEQQDATRDPQKDLGDTGAGVAEIRPSLEIGDLTSAFQHFSISTVSELDRLSTSDVVTFLESCQLRDYSSGDSVSECSSKGTLNKEVNKELKQGEISGEEYKKQPCEEETLGTSEEWIESEDNDSLKNTSRFTQCSLETLSEVLTKIGQELQTNCEDCDGKDAGNLLLLNIHNNTTSENLREKVPPQEMTGSLAHASEPPPLAAALDTRGSSPASGGPDNEDTESRPEDRSEASRRPDGAEELQAAPAEPPALCSDSAAEPGTEQSASCEVETTFQYQISTVTSEVINVLINKDQNLVIEDGDNWTVISGVAVVPHMEQVTLCEVSGDIPVSQDQGGLDAGCAPMTSVEKTPEASHTGPPFQEPPCGSSNLSCPQEDVSSSAQSTNFDKSRLRNRPVKPSIWISSQIYDQDFDSQTVASDHTYYNSKLEPFSKNKNRSKISNKDQSNKPVKTLASSRIEAHQSEVSQSLSGEKSNTKTQRSQTQTILANADTSTPTDCSADTLSKIRQEVGPPLPPLLAPLIATPPRTSQPLSPLAPSSSPPSPPSPIGQISPFCEIPVPPVMSPWPEDPRRTSPPGPSPSPSAASAGQRIVSSPLQFCAATPKHALPVPGRLPPCASGHAAVGGPQENSVKILDTMYPELSARARTLNILKGNIQFTRGPSSDCKNLPGPVSAMIGFKAITSTSTAFVKTGSSSGGDCSLGKARDLGTQQDSSGKRTLSAPTLRSAKRLRLDGGSPEPEIEATAEGIHKNLQGNLPQAEVTTEEERSCSSPAVSTVSQLPLNPKETVESHDKAIANALRKIAELSFDLLPVIRSHVYVGNISKKPVMRDQEKEVVYEFSTTKKHLAECLLHSILSELKIQKMSTDHNYIHALCRVYVGICRQLGDLERARVFCYSLLKEDFPESEKLTLFIANMWHDIFLSQSVINKAMQLVARQRAKGEVLNCLRAFLNWEKNAPADVGFMVSKLLLTIQLCPKTEFQASEKFGEDLSDNTWEYILAIDLLCCHQKWIWTHDNIISKELWPVMDKWIKYRKGHANIAYIPDIIIASILRLIGRLGQLGLKEGFPSAVKNISSVIGMFIQHAQDEDIPWGIQLAAVYALCDLSPSNPAEIYKILEAWQREASKSVPSAILSCLEEVSALSAEGLG
uniref:Interactor of little elongation complex ELL subunit 1 n=1 Tax=Prolemur simus TaxID=1328070 RepID=A0A8C8ZBR5_PROSS